MERYRAGINTPPSAPPGKGQSGVTPRKSRHMRYADLPYGKAPSGICRWCGGAVPPGCRTWCGKDDCIHQYRLRSDAGYVRRLVYDRDGGECSVCGVATDKIRWEIAAIKQEHWRLVRQNNELRWVAGWLFREWSNWRNGEYGHSSPWEADHIIPVIEGGGWCGLENYRTLCVPCHRAQTAALAGRRADRRANQPRML